MTAPAPRVLRTAHHESIAAYWINEQDPVNVRLGAVDDLYHHRLQDDGSGRAGRTFMAKRPFGCRVDGATTSEEQVEFVNGRQDPNS